MDFNVRPQIYFEPNTIIITVGATGCGKTHFIREYLVPQITKQSYNVRIISVDDIREEILGEKLNGRNNEKFYSVSDGAYSMLKAKAECYIKYPTCKFAEFLIIDSSGLDIDLHEYMKKIAQENNYNVHVVVFEFKKIENLLEHSSNKELSRKQNDAMRMKILPYLKKLKNISVSYLSKNFDDYDLTVKNNCLQMEIKKFKKIIVFGSALGDIDVFNKVNEIIFEPDDVLIIMGNYIGTNANILNALDVIMRRNIKVYVLRGYMEENFKQKLTDLTEKQRDMFLKIWENSYNYIKIGKYEFTTSLCERRKLKTDGILLNDNLNIIPSKCHYIHVCSYPLVSNAIMINSAYLLGERHTILTIDEWSKKSKTSDITMDNIYSFMISVDTSSMELKLKNYNLVELDYLVQKRVKNLLKNKINYISGTISPSDKNIQKGLLETISCALWYYHNFYKNSGLLSIQVKDMGSRLQFYYFKNCKEDSYAVSRNGYIANLSRETLNRLYDEITPKLQKFDCYEDSKLIILDGELMPWSALGKSLIDYNFVQLYESAKDEVDLLEEFGFEKHQKNLINDFNSSDFIADSSKMKKQEVYNKYGGSKYESYSLVKQNERFYQQLSDKKKGIYTFGDQLEIFGKKCEQENIYYKPFSILKVVLSDDTEIITEGNVEMYSKLSNNQTLTIDLSNDINSNIKLVEQFWDDVIVPGKYEGIIVKPDIVNPNFAPCLKVRNSNYLHIIYGPDYLSPIKYESLIKKKNIRDKLSTSIKEYKIGQMMLNVKYNNISESDQMTNLYCNFIDEEEKEKTFDKAL